MRKSTPGLAHQAGDQFGLLGLHVADGNVGLAALQVAQRVGRDHLYRNAGRLCPQALQDGGQQVRRHYVGG